MKLAEAEGHAPEWLAERAGISATTLRRWRAERAAGKRAPEPRGPRPEGMSRRLLRGLFEFAEECLAAGVRALHRACPDVPRRWLEWIARSIRRRRERRQQPSALTWTRVGAVWAIDHSELEVPIDEEFRFLLVVKDLASGRVLSALPTRSTDGAPVAEELERLFLVHGPPLVIKKDNGSGLIGPQVARVLERYGVTALRSPPRTPQFNGSVEAGMGSLKGAIAAIAAAHGRAAAWTRDDLYGALEVQRQLGGPRGARQSPEEAWRARRRIDPEERAAFRAALAEEEARLLRDRPECPILRRRAVRTVLTNLDYLVIRRP